MTITYDNMGRVLVAVLLFGWALTVAWALVGCWLGARKDRKQERRKEWERRVRHIARVSCGEDVEPEFPPNQEFYGK